MTYAIVWAPVALWTFYRLPMHSATVVDRALIRFGATGEGHLEWVAPYHRLRAGVYAVALHIDRAEGTINVLSIYRPR